jgi:hypothetical protein
MTTEIIIVISPSFDRRGKRRHDRFDARLKDDAEVICAATRQPLLDTSRVLLARRFDPSTVLCMVHSHAPTVVTLRSPIGVAAQFDVMGEKFVRRKVKITFVNTKRPRQSAHRNPPENIQK